MSGGPFVPEPAGARLRGRACLGFVLLAGVALWVPRLEGPIDLRYDAGAYYVLGTSLAQGTGYRLLNEPGEIEAVQYPPLLPLIVAAHQRALRHSDPVVVGHALRLSFLLLSLAHAAATFLVARVFLPPAPALFASLLSSLSLNGYLLSDLCFAEIPFALASMLVFLASRATHRWSGLLSALLAVAAFLLRTSGLALLAAWVGESLWARRFGQAAVRGATALLPILLWQGHIDRVQSGPGYQAPAYAYQRAPYQYHNVSYVENARLIDPFRPERGEASGSDLLRRAADNLRFLPVSMGEAISVPRRFWAWALFMIGRELGLASVGLRLAPIAMAFLGLAVLPGLLALSRRGGRLVLLYVLLSLAMICLAPWPAQFGRYLTPLAPFLAIALILGLRDGVRLLQRRGRVERAVAILAAAGVPALALGVQGFALVKSFAEFHPRVEYVDSAGGRSSGRLFFYDDAWRAFDASLRWLKDNARPGEVVATSAPQHVFLHTGLKSVMPPLEPDVRTAQRLLDSVPVTYVVIDDLSFTDISRRYAAPPVESQPELWALAHAEARGAPRIYRRLE